MLLVAVEHGDLAQPFVQHLLRIVEKVEVFLVQMILAMLRELEHRGEGFGTISALVRRVVQVGDQVRDRNGQIGGRVVAKDADL